MATTPTTPTTFQPAFKRVAQQGRHDDTFAAIAILTGKTLDAIMRQAETMGLPKIGPFHSYIDGDLIARICAAHGLVCTVWKECTKGYAELPEVAIAMVSYDADWEMGRCVVYRLRRLDHYLPRATNTGTRCSTRQVAAGFVGDSSTREPNHPERRVPKHLPLPAPILGRNTLFR